MKLYNNIKYIYKYIFKIMIIIKSHYLDMFILPCFDILQQSNRKRNRSNNLF